MRWKRENKNATTTVLSDAALESIASSAFPGSVGRGAENIDTAKEKFAELGSELWVAPKELQEEVSSEQYSAAAFEGWYDRAEEIGVDGQAYVEQIREALGREGS